MPASASNSDAAGVGRRLPRRIRLVVEYDGTNFVGWQRQDNGPSIQGLLEEAAGEVTRERVSVIGAGRTDAGVHAAGQVATFTTHSVIPLAGLRRGLNAQLPHSIAVVAIDEVPGDFDPRKRASGKLYRYVIWNADARSPLLDRFAWHVKPRLDARRMHEAARPLVGEHDFQAFRAADCDRQDTVRRMHRLDVIRQGHRIDIEVEASGLLKQMVRIIVGTLVDVGRGYRPVDYPARILAARDRRLAGPTAPPQGLTLVRVDYDLLLPERP